MRLQNLLNGAMDYIHSLHHRLIDATYDGCGVPYRRSPAVRGVWSRKMSFRRETSAIQQYNIAKCNDKMVVDMCRHTLQQSVHLFVWLSRTITRTKNNNFTPDLQLKSELLPTQRTAAKASASRNVIKRRSVGVVF